MAIPEHVYKDLEHHEQKRDELAKKLSQSIERNESLEVRRDLEKQLEPIDERVAKLQEYISKREREISEGKSI